jgi:hypothetical protein
MEGGGGVWGGRGWKMVGESGMGKGSRGGPFPKVLLALGLRATIEKERVAPR